MDVVALYPSISVELALEAMADAFKEDTIHNITTKRVVSQLSEFILRQSFIVFEEEVYVNKQGIPTGNCISRQIADIAMHWLLFKKLSKRAWGIWDFIGLWKRYIDDILGRWRGTERQFSIASSTN